jgi:uncharacterized ubiquitin-like protein YukD
MSEQKIKTEEIPKIEDFPVEWQIIIRGTQSLASKARDGADITIVKEENYFAFITKKTSLEVKYYPDRKMLEVVWKRYKFVNDEREPTFIKTIEKRMNENEARKLMFAWFEKILYHVDYKSNNTIIFQDFHYLYKAYEEQKEEAKQ